MINERVLLENSLRTTLGRFGEKVPRIGIGFDEYNPQNIRYTFDVGSIFGGSLLKGSVELNESERTLYTIIAAREKALVYHAQDAAEHFARTLRYKTLALQGEGHPVGKTFRFTQEGGIAEYAMATDTTVIDMEHKDGWWRRDLKATTQPARTHLDKEFLVSTHTVQNTLACIFPGMHFSTRAEYSTYRCGDESVLAEIIRFRKPLSPLQFLAYALSDDGKTNENNDLPSSTHGRILYESGTDDEGERHSHELRLGLATDKPSKVLPAILYFYPLARALNRDLLLMPYNPLVEQQAMELVNGGFLHVANPDQLGTKNFIATPGCEGAPAPFAESKEPISF